MADFIHWYLTVNPNYWCVLGCFMLFGGFGMIAVFTVEEGRRVASFICALIVIAGIVLLAANAMRADDYNISLYINRCHALNGTILRDINGAGRCIILDKSPAP
jgi:hypothetical protein